MRITVRGKKTEETVVGGDTIRHEKEVQLKKKCSDLASRGKISYTPNMGIHNYKTFKLLNNYIKDFEIRDNFGWMLYRNNPTHSYHICNFKSAL